MSGNWSPSGGSSKKPKKPKGKKLPSGGLADLKNQLVKAKLRNAVYQQANKKPKPVAQKKVDTYIKKKPYVIPKMSAGKPTTNTQANKLYQDDVNYQAKKWVYQGTAHFLQVVVATLSS